MALLAPPQGLRLSRPHGGLAMPCKICPPTYRIEFPSEISIHPPRGWPDFRDTGVLAFPVLQVCMNCGHVEFELEDDAFRRLQEKYADSTR